MYGPTIGSLRVYLNSTGHMTRHWVKSSDQGNKWHKTSIGIGKQSNPFRIVIEGRGECNILNIFSMTDTKTLYQV